MVNIGKYLEKFIPITFDRVGFRIIFKWGIISLCDMATGVKCVPSLIINMRDICPRLSSKFRFFHGKSTKFDRMIAINYHTEHIHPAE